MTLAAFIGEVRAARHCRKGTTLKSNTDLPSLLAKDQRSLLKNLRNETKQLAELLKVIAVSQDVDAVRKEHMEFLGVVGSRILSPEEIELSKEGIRFDDLRRICGRKIESYTRREGFRNSLPEGHLLKMVFAEHDMIQYYLANLAKIITIVQKCSGWDEADKHIDKILHLIRHMCSMDPHIKREEQIILPHFQSSGYDEAPRLVYAEHVKLKKRRLELGNLADSARKTEFGPWIALLAITASDYIPHVREHIRKEEMIIYPNAVSIIQDPEKWETMKTACDEIGICCFE